MTYDIESFLAGLQLGRRLKELDTKRSDTEPARELPIITQRGSPILTETGLELRLEA